MSLFTRTVAQIDQLDGLMKHFDETPNDPMPTRKESADAVNAVITEVTPIVKKFVTKAEAGERDPNKRMYGAGMVSKIFALNDRFHNTCTEFTPRYETLLEEWNTYESEQRIEEDRQRAEEEEKRVAEEARLEAERIEIEKREQAERLRLQKEEEEKVQRQQEEAAALKLEEEKREAERQKQEADRLAEEKKRMEQEEKEATLKKEQEVAAKALASMNDGDGAGQAGTISISIKTTRGVTHSLKNLPATATVQDLKDIIQREHGINNFTQRLIFQGRLLVNAKLISSYKIVDGSAVHLVESAQAAGASSSSAGPQINLIVPPGTLGVVHNGKQEYEAIAAQCGNERLLVVDWFAPWCGPCRAISPAFERLARRFSDVTFIKIDTEASDANGALATEMQVTEYPTFHFVENHVLKHSLVGANATALEANMRKFHETVFLDRHARHERELLASSSSSGMTSRLVAALTSLKRTLPSAEFIVAVRTLLTFVRNIVSNPGIEKYRRVRTGNSTFHSRLGSKQGGIECMTAFGFTSVVENNVDFLIMSAELAENSELSTVMTQLESAIAASSRNMGASAPTAANPPATGRAGGTGGLQGPTADGMAGLFGNNGQPGGPGQQEVLNPVLDRFFREFGSDPEAMATLLEVHRAIENRDMAAVRRLEGHPALHRIQNTVTNDPALLSMLMQHIAEGGAQGIPGMEGLANMANTGAGVGRGGGAQGARGGAGGTPVAPQPAAPQYPGVPSTAEEEERLLQEAIRLSMQEQQKPEGDGEVGGANDGSKDKET